MFFARRRRILRFIYSPAAAGAGTTVMRGRQLADLTAGSGLTDREIRFETIDEHVRSADLFLTKGAARSLDPDIARRLRRRGNRLFLDPVDEDVSDEIAATADAVVAASASAEADFRSRWPRTRIVRVDHHVDPRLRAVLDSAPARPDDRFVARYFGESVNTVITDRIAGEVDFIQVDTSRQDVEWMKEVPAAHLHYAMRRHRALDRHKPFLKGFTAAAAGANVLVGRDEKEAAHWLPVDYPYWVAAGADEQTILAALEHARTSFQGAEWKTAQEAMRTISERTTDRVIVRQLLDAVE